MTAPCSTVHATTGRATDRVFVPAAFAGRLADMPSRRDVGAWVGWLCARLAELRDPTVVGSVHGLEALRLATQVHRELAALTVTPAVALAVTSTGTSTGASAGMSAVARAGG